MLPIVSACRLPHLSLFLLPRILHLLRPPHRGFLPHRSPAFPQVRAVFLDRYKFQSTWDYIQTGLEGIVAFMMVWHLIQELVEMYTYGLSKYIRSLYVLFIGIRMLCPKVARG